MATAHILLAEDDPNLAFVLQEQLEQRGFDVTLCSDGIAAEETFAGSNIDLCLLDVMLPKQDGFTLARAIRAQDEQVPILFLTAKSLKEDRIEGFRLGGDDYITKPFSLEELVLRIEAVLRRARRARSADPENSRFGIGQYTFDYSELLLFNASSRVKLTVREAELLRLLCRQQNDMLERSQALEHIWGEDNYFNGRSMDVFISRLRKYLSADPNIEIRNIHGRGFKLIIKPA